MARRASITPHALLATIDAGDAPPILDVRTPREFAAGHVPGAVNIPFHTVIAGAPPPHAAPGDTLVVYCGHGPRAWMAARALRSRGFARIVYLSGHWAGWERAGLRRDEGV